MIYFSPIFFMFSKQFRPKTVRLQTKLIVVNSRPRPKMRKCKNDSFSINMFIVLISECKTCFTKNQKISKNHRAHYEKKNPFVRLIRKILLFFKRKYHIQFSALETLQKTIETMIFSISNVNIMKTTFCTNL